MAPAKPPIVGDAAGPPPDLMHPVVLQVLPSLVTGGVERGTVDIAEAIVTAGGTAVVASEGGPMTRELARIGAHHVELPLATKNPLQIRRNARRLEEVIRRWSVDIVHARSRAPGWSALWAARACGLPFVTTFHAPYAAGNLLKRLYNSVMAKGDRVIAISDYVAEHVRTTYGVGEDRLRTVHRGIDLNRFSPESVSQERLIRLSNAWRLPEDARVILLAGRLSRWKGQTTLIRAAAILGRKDLRVVLAGSPQGRSAYVDELERLARSLGVDGIVQLAAQVDDMPAAYMLSDVVVHASTDPEGFGRVIAEAQAMGRPVIASEIGAPPEIIEDGVTGWLVPPGDPEALARAIGAALSLDEVSRRELGRRAIDRVARHFSLQQMADRTIEIYEELLSAR